MLDRLRLFGAIALAVAPTNPNSLGLPGLVEKSSSGVVEQHAGLRRHVARAEEQIHRNRAATRLPAESSTEKCVVCMPTGSDSMPGNMLEGMALSTRMLLRCPAA